MEFHHEYLGKPIVPTWIYASADPSDGEFEETIRAVERALGFDLFIWQKTFIKNGEFRKMGATTAEILRDLLNVSGEPIDYSRPPKTNREQFHRMELRHIKQKLDDAGIPTRHVWFSERDKINMRWETRPPQPACFLKPWARDCKNCLSTFCDYKEKKHGSETIL